MQGLPKIARQLFIILISGLFIYSGPGIAGEGAEKPFQPSENLTADVDGVLALALENNKLALIIMGANWCHDSMGLYSHFQDPELMATLEANFELVFVDVGYLEFGKEVIQRFGQPVIYGTPTVLIIDPETEQLLNGETMHRLRDSAKMDIEEARTYFAATAALGAANLDIPPNDPTLMALFKEIDAFEEEQASRIYRGFAVLSPMMRADEEEGTRDEKYLPYWKELADLRYTITDDLARLRREARDLVAAGETDINLGFPEYPPFSWE
ncbi:MAG: thioredoxin family protein [Alphaproteobacteria bacterium]